jgi:hypothetical protein
MEFEVFVRLFVFAKTKCLRQAIELRSLDALQIMRVRKFTHV